MSIFTGSKARIIYLCAIILCIVFGLASRKFGSHLPPIIAEHAGDMLWAMMVYAGFRFLFVHARVEIALLLSMLFSFSIECSQLYQADWINSIRNTTLGGLLLGKGFLYVDLVRYAIGILLVWVLDKWWIRGLEQKNKR